MVCATCGVIYRSRTNVIYSNELDSRVVVEEFCHVWFGTPNLDVYAPTTHSARQVCCIKKSSTDSSGSFLCQSPPEANSSLLRMHAAFQVNYCRQSKDG